MDLTPLKPFTISREFNAPLSLLWQVQTQAEHLQHWLNPDGFRTIHADMDFQVGGHYHYGIEGPNKMKMWGMQRFLEILPEQKIVHIQSFSNQSGGLERHPMAPSWPAYMHVTAVFENGHKGGTNYTICWQPYESDEQGHSAFNNATEGMQSGFDGTFAKLEAYLLNLQS
jgi:uncharacterized protein YndB with AHSA1/START domain